MLLNLFTIMFFGSYVGMDGSLEEDSQVYDLAYFIAELIGTIN